MPVEVFRKRALASSIERSELLASNLANLYNEAIEGDLPVYGRRGSQCKRKIFLDARQ